MSDPGAGPSRGSVRRSRQSRSTTNEIRAIFEKSESEDEPVVASDEEEYFPEPAISASEEESDAERELIVEEEAEYDSDESDDSEEEQPAPANVLTARDGTQWNEAPFPQTRTMSHNIMRKRGGPANFSRIFTAKETFKSILSNEIIDIILRETNRKGQRVTNDFNNKLIEKYPDPARRPPQKVFNPFTEQEFDAFLGILIEAGMHKSNKEHLTELWRLDSLPLIRASMARDRFKMVLRFIRFDNENTCTERARTDKAAPIRDIWTMLNRNLQNGHKPYECITVDEQLFPYRGHTKFTQYIPSKPAKYGIKVFWACDSTNAYPLQGQLYTGKPPEGKRQVNVGERTVLDLVAAYKGSGRNVTTDNFFTSLELARVLKSWNMTLVGTVRKNKRFLPPNMQPSKNREILSTNFAFSKDATVCSYVPKKNKSVILLSSMHMTADVEDTVAAKPEIITYYNQTKGGVDKMDQMLSEYTVKRRTSRWSLAFFYNMVDVAALAAYIIHMEHNQKFRASSDRRRKFLKDLANQLCMPSIEERTTNPNVVRNHFTRNSMELVLRREITPRSVTPGGSMVPRTNPRHAAVVGRCYICKQGDCKDRKTRKACSVCDKPVCDEHSVNRPICNTCIEQPQ